MPTVGEEAGTATGIPHPHGFIRTGRGEALAIRRPCHAQDRTSMAAVGEEAGTAAGHTVAPDSVPLASDQSVGLEPAAGTGPSPLA